MVQATLEMIKMKQYKILTLTLLSALSLQGCSIMEPIGKEEFACPNEKKGGVCAGPRTIYELTNTRANLENLEGDSEYDGYVIKNDEDGNIVAVKNSSKKKDNQQEHQHDEHDQEHANHNNEKHNVRYTPRDHSQQTSTLYQTPKVIPQLRDEPVSNDPFNQWPKTSEPLAPEPLSVLEPPKVMRILLNSYKDRAGNLHMPGYLYVQVETETWSVGEAASMRPQRVVPLELRQKAAQENKDRAYRQKGVSPIEHQDASNGG